MMILNKPGFQMMERSLDAATLRQRVIADNIANVDTPFFSRDRKFDLKNCCSRK